MVKIGVISDTHGVLWDEVMENLKDCAYIIHAGDIGSEEILYNLKETARTFAVRGNNDRYGYAMDLPEYLEIKLGGKSFYITHIRDDVPDGVLGADIVIFGHSHKYYEGEKEGVLYLNPGSCGRRRFSLPLTMAILEIDDGKVEIKKIDID